MDGVSQVVKNPRANARDPGDVGLISGKKLIHAKIPWRRAWQPTPVFLPGESPWTEEPAGCSPWGRTELGTTEATERMHTCGWALGPLPPLALMNYDALKTGGCITVSL